MLEKVQEIFNHYGLNLLEGTHRPAHYGYNTSMNKTNRKDVVIVNSDHKIIEVILENYFDIEKDIYKVDLHYFVLNFTIIAKNFLHVMIHFQHAY